jgi:glutamyl/glutaminyl-tRNA synthetase
LEDLTLLEVVGDRVTHTSDYFEQLYGLAIKLIESGNAYADDTEQMKVRTRVEQPLRVCLREADATRAYGRHRFRAAGCDGAGEPGTVCGDEDGECRGPAVVHPRQDQRGQP